MINAELPAPHPDDIHQGEQTRTQDQAIQTPAETAATQIHAAAEASREGRITRLGDVIGWDTVQAMKTAKAAATAAARRRVAAGLPLSPSAVDYINSRSGRASE